MRKKNSKAIAVPQVRDSLKSYLAEISKYPVIGIEQEKALIKKMEAGDMNAAKMLVMSNLRLVVKIAFEYKSTYQNVMDLIQEGNIGLMKAVSMYDPNKGAKLSYYASWWIRSYILKFLIDNFRLVKLGTTQAQRKLFYNLIQEQKQIEAQGKLALPGTLEKNLHVKTSEIQEMQTRLSSTAEVSIDQPINSNDPESSSLLDLYQDNSYRPDELNEAKELNIMLREKLFEFSKTLNEKEKTILKDRLLNDTPLTLQEIANRHGISKERTRQIESKIIKNLKKELYEFNHLL